MDCKTAHWLAILISISAGGCGDSDGLAYSPEVEPLLIASIEGEEQLPSTVGQLRLLEGHPPVLTLVGEDIGGAFSPGARFVQLRVYVDPRHISAGSAFPVVNSWSTSDATTATGTVRAMYALGEDVYPSLSGGIHFERFTTKELEVEFDFVAAHRPEGPRFDAPTRDTIAVRGTFVGRYLVTCSIRVSEVSHEKDDSFESEFCRPYKGFAQ